MPHKILVASYTSHIATLVFNPETTPPALTIESSLEVGHHPSWITPHPTDKSVVFTATEAADGVVKAIKYDLESGRGEIIAQVSSGGADPCSLIASSDELFVGNYSGGSLAVFPLGTSSPYLPVTASQIISFSGTGPVTSRQEGSHPHQVLIHPGREEVIIPDLGADKIWRLQKEGSEWVVKDDIEAPPGGGPRHAIVLGDTLYTLMELSNYITSHKLPAVPEKATLTSTIATLSNPPINPTSLDPPPLSAEILSPAPSSDFPVQYLYVTNRNDPSPEGDILSIFEVKPDSSLDLVKEVRTGLNHLRGIAFDETNRYLVAGGTMGHGAKVFERIDGGKDFKEIVHLKDVESPTGFHWLPVA
ncbi:hypothetical protein M422DRAFT_158305 [Sphaerobolus stellatus SS14]|nr:hypothetical protein M422DRAFT_158305 [Sphaerobolus stellatus SS14]